MNTATLTPSKTAYGYENGSLIIDALTDGQTLEFAARDDHTIKVWYKFHPCDNRDEICIIHADGTGCGCILHDPFEWLFGKLTAYGYHLLTELF